ncbi:MAG: acyltransferase family protein [Prevotella sp.]
MSHDNSTYLASKPRYEILDGLRGVAAMMVVAFHLFETYSPGVVHQIVNHGYLAVDFFFCLSGFVIGYAYDERMATGKMSIMDFLKRRLVRLHPMVCMGAMIGFLLFYMGGGPDFGMMTEVEWWQLVVLLLIAFTMVPVSKSMDVRGWSETYPLNGATWSLMLEYIANLLYVFFIRRLGKVALGICVALFALLTLTLTFNMDPFGVFPEDNYAAYTVIGGWGVDAPQLYIGLTRLLYPFFMGLLLSRTGRFISVKGGFWWCALIIIICQTMPRVGGIEPENFWMNGLYESVVILVVFPLVVAMGAGSKVVGRKSQKVCTFLGDISYPLYITHYPLIYVQMGWALDHKDAPLGQHIMIAVSIFCIAIAVAWASLKLYDEPVREWLKDYWLGRKRSS